MMIPKLFVVAGGSGGHILPALQCAQEWLIKNPSGQIFFFTGTTDLEKKIVKSKPFIHKIIYCDLPKFSLRRWWLLPWLVIQTTIIFFRAFFYALWHKPELVIGTGGILCVPVGTATRLARRRLEVYELNVVPGKAIKALIPFAHVLHIVFPQTADYCRWGRIDFSKKCQVSPYPLRFTQSDQQFDKSSIIKRINAQLFQQHAELVFENSRKTLFILGGSQGSQLLNTIIRNFIESRPDLAGKIQVIHQAGSFDEIEWYNWYTTRNVPALMFSYDQNIHEFYLVSDLIISRAGAGTLFEIMFFNKQCLLIPLVAQTTDHQIYNARAMAQLHPELFAIIEQDAAIKHPTTVFQKIEEMLNN